MPHHDAVGCQPYKEPLRNTLVRTGAIALVVGAVLSLPYTGLSHWSIATLLALWPSLGGHWVELWFLNYLRPRLPVAPAVQVGVRLGLWFVGGIGLALGMRMTAMALAGSQRTDWPAWWLAGLAFIGIELAAHLALQLRGRPSFYNRRG